MKSEFHQKRIKLLHHAAEFVVGNLQQGAEGDESKREEDEPAFSKHNILAGSHEVSVVCGSWNVGNKPPPKASELTHWFHDTPADIYVVGAQVCVSWLPLRCFAF